jgi:hypothetical protein
MNHVIITDPSNVNITQFSQPTELRDPSGYVLGVFSPAKRRAPGEPDDALEELEATASELGGYTLEEIWRELGAK